MLNYVELVKAQIIKLKAFISIKIYNNEQNTIKNILHDGADTYNGALRLTHEEGNLNWGQDFYRGALTFDASFSNPIYGASSTVQPPALTMRYIIKY